MDLRGTISAVVHLPFDSDKLTDILLESEPTVANKPDAEDHTTFWLVIADQFPKRSIAGDRVREIIDSGADVAMREKRGMNASDLRKRPPPESWTDWGRWRQLGNRMVGRPWSSLTEGGRSISSPVPAADNFEGRGSKAGA
jgi:hypothetical protein